MNDGNDGNEGHEGNEAKDALARSDERLRLAKSAANIGVYDFDVAARTIEWDERVRALWGVRPEEPVTYELYMGRIHDEDRPRVQAGIERALDPMGTGQIASVHRVVNRIDGVTRWISAMGQVSFEDGKPKRLVGTVQDVTAAKAAEAALAASEERLRFLDTFSEATRAASDPFAVLAATTRLLGERLNAARCAYADVDADNDHFTIPHDWTAPGVTSTAGDYELHRFGAVVADDLRRGKTTVVCDVDRELGSDGCGAMFAAIGVQSIICCPLVKDGRLVALMAVHQLVPRDWTPQEVALVSEVVDRSWAHIERARAMEALREQDRRKDEFLATLAHELRNPLAPIRTGLFLLRTSNGERADKIREMMDRQLGHMVRLIDDLLDISRVSRGQFELRRDRITARTVIDSALETLKPLIESRRHAVTTSVPEEPIWIHGDLTRLAQVIGNLLNNAAKYTAEGGTIDVTVTREEPGVVIRVEDDGAGISSEMLPRVFDLFAQGARTLGQAQGGLGIGLSLVRRLVEMHGGTVDAASDIGRGSVFTVRLPIVAGAPSPRTKEAPSAATRGRRILVVDDNLDGAEMLAAMLALQAHETRTASDGPTAIAAARSFAPEVVFLDIGLPGMDGFEAARALRRDASARVVLVALTGWGSAEDRRRTKEAGFDFHLTKPVSATDVDAILRDLV
ncbi:hypothetical protein BH09MYX1_BH09MYX1_35900 [soil metagenome]